MFSSLSEIITVGLSLISLVLAGLFYREKTKREEAQEERDIQKHKARDEEDAREALQETAENTREVEESVERTPADDRRDELRKYTKSGGDSD